MQTSIQVTRNALQRLDLIRKQRGIRTRAKAIEMVLEEFMQSEDPLEVLLRSPRSPDPIPTTVQKAVKADQEVRAEGQKVKTTAHATIKARLEERRKNAA
jgi:hypothetical protein